MGGEKERLREDRDEEFYNKKWGASYGKKKLEVCLELQRGQEN